METALKAYIPESNELDAPLTVEDIKVRVDLIQQVMRSVMKEDTHFGVIPGCGDKPTLYKAGAEKILTTFRIAVKPLIENLSTEDEIRYRIICQAYTPSGKFLGSGVGECSSNEEKYKWRKAVCDEEFNETSEDRRCVPSWMTDPTRCALLTFGWQPFVSYQALRRLDALLASLDEPDSEATLGF